MNYSARLPRFNIAAVPVESVCRKDFFRAAESLGSQEDGYLLAPNKALPHVTLCQFRAQNDEEAIQLVKDFIGEEMVLRTAGVYLSKAGGGRGGKFCIGYIVACSDRLTSLQSEIVDRLRKNSVEVFTKRGKDYFPHFTLARTTKPATKLDEKIVFSERLIEAPLACRVRLGSSDENGQFLKTLDGVL